MALLDGLRSMLERFDDRTYPLYLLTAILLLCLWGIAYIPSLELRVRILVDGAILFTGLLVLWAMAEALLIVIKSTKR